MRRIAYVFLIPLLLPPGPPDLRAQSEDDARWALVRVVTTNGPVSIESR